MRRIAKPHGGDKSDATAATERNGTQTAARPAVRGEQSAVEPARATPP
ncbi:MAG: hypothetical protein ACYC5U_11255 [Rhodocyclaceae bacterium]